MYGDLITDHWFTHHSTVISTLFLIHTPLSISRYKLNVLWQCAYSRHQSRKLFPSVYSGCSCIAKASESQKSPLDFLTTYLMWTMAVLFMTRHEPLIRPRNRVTFSIGTLPQNTEQVFFHWTIVAFATKRKPLSPSQVILALICATTQQSYCCHAGVSRPSARHL